MDLIFFSMFSFSLMSSYKNLTFSCSNNALQKVFVIKQFFKKVFLFFLFSLKPLEAWESKRLIRHRLLFLFVFKRLLYLHMVLPMLKHVAQRTPAFTFMSAVMYVATADWNTSLKELTIFAWYVTKLFFSQTLSLSVLFYPVAGLDRFYFIGSSFSGA